ncbi:hypothetical protein Syun_017226 [Stephania yunnanensis]|uniref:Uncharacterized protein n=1 Tax=Stephania yunnanensis TaxID=152371 RepID=A0AAP0J6J1_9MAGN
MGYWLPIRPIVLVLAFEELVTSHRFSSMEIDGKEVKAQIWDTARQDRFHVVILCTTKVYHSL